MTAHKRFDHPPPTSATEFSAMDSELKQHHGPFLEVNLSRRLGTGSMKISMALVRGNV
jgi:hypothetical protein